MEIKAYIATLNTEYSVEVHPCNEIPDFVHMVKFDNERGIELYFSANTEWTPEQERLAFEQILQDYQPLGLPSFLMPSPAASF